MDRPAGRLANSVALVTLETCVVGLTMLVLTLDHPPVGGLGPRGFTLLFAVVAAPVGWLIMRRQPTNRIGLVMSLVGVVSGVQLLLTEYAAAGQRTSLPASNLAALINAFIWVPAVAMMAGAVPLYFPDGRLPSPRWRPVPWLLAGSSALLMAIFFVYPSAIGTPRIGEPYIRLPIADAVIDQTGTITFTALAIAILLSGLSPVLRWRRASGVVREQLKWLTLSAVLIVVTMSLSLLPSFASETIFIAAIATMPIAVGVAVLRYRPYEVDTVINRTLEFGALTAILTGGFAALQKLLQEILGKATGNETDAATIITTLILAAAFAPPQEVARAAGGSSTQPPGASQRTPRSRHTYLRISGVGVDERVDHRRGGRPRGPAAPRRSRGGHRGARRRPGWGPPPGAQAGDRRPAL